MPSFVLHRPGDHVGVATEDIAAGSDPTGGYRDLGETVIVGARDDVPLGHKIAVTAIASGEPVIEYGVAIGVATQDIAPGAHVHVHNLKGQRWA